MRRLKSAGFTLIEMLVIAPIVILAIGAFLTVIISMTGEVLASRASNVLAYDVQDALNRIEQDVKLSTGFLAKSNITLVTGDGTAAYNNGLAQGMDDGSTPWENIQSNGDKALILNMLVTNGNPLSTGTGIVYLKDKPNSCASVNVTRNIPMTMNVIYYIKDNALWRRTMMPSQYANSSLNCTTPWQQPSCSPGYTAAFCKTNDEKLVEGITQSSFTLEYFAGAASTAANAAATTYVSGDQAAARIAALKGMQTLGVSLSATQNVAGRTVERSATLRASRLDTNATTVADTTTYAAPSTPVVSARVATPDIATFTWRASSGGNVKYTVEYNINGGSWTTGATDSTSLTFTKVAIRGQTVNVRVKATNPADSTGTWSNTASTTIPLWNPLTMQNLWTNYDTIHTSAAYTKTNDGMIVVKGMIKRQGSYASGETIATLPSGYRPAYSMSFDLQTSGTTYGGQVLVQPNGDIIAGTGVSESWLALNNIRFLPSTSSYNWTNLTLSSGWVNRGNVDDPPSPAYTVDGVGRVHIRGTLDDGTNTTGADIIVIPSQIVPSADLLLPLRSGSNGFNEVKISVADTSFEARGLSVGTAMFYFFNYFPSTYTSWTAPTLTSSWVNYNNNFATAGYTKSSDDVVSLRGLIKSGTTSNGTSVMTLPAGYRPLNRQTFMVTSAQSAARMDVMPDGQVIVYGVSATWVSLSSISFLAEQ